MDGETQPPRREKNHGEVEANVQEGAGGLLLLAAANETGLLCDLETAIASCKPTVARSLLSCSPHCRRQLMLTLLFFPLSGLSRTCDLRGYTGGALGVLTGRPRAYGYYHTDLSQLAKLCSQAVQLLRVATCPPSATTAYANGSVPRRPCFGDTAHETLLLSSLFALFLF
jgi:hypothetical protein